jgi:hypothetical protein
MCTVGSEFYNHLRIFGLTIKPLDDALLDLGQVETDYVNYSNEWDRDISVWGDLLNAQVVSAT